MKKLFIIFIFLLWSSNSLASDHYFAQSGTDAGTCNAAACTNSGAPCKTITCANAVIAALSNGANQILFNRGDTWSLGSGGEAESLIVDVSGTSTSARLIIGDYSTGNKPKFDCASTTQTSNPVIYIGSNSWVTIQNLEIYDFPRVGIGYGVNNTVQGILITGNTVYNNRGSSFYILGLETERLGQGGGGTGTASEIEVSYNTISLSGWNGIKVYGCTGTGNSVHHNTIYNCQHNGIDMLSFSSTTIDVYSNNIYDCVCGIYGPSLINSSIYDNDIHDSKYSTAIDPPNVDPVYGIKIGIQSGPTPTSITYRNNRFYNIDVTNRHVASAALCINENVNSKIYNNTIYASYKTYYSFVANTNLDVHNNLCYANTNGGDPNTYPDMDNYGSDPLFVSVVTPKFNLLAGSPVIDQGVGVGLAFTGAAPDLGAYEGIGGIITLNGSGTMTLGAGGSAVLR